MLISRQFRTALTFIVVLITGLISTSVFAETSQEFISRSLGTDIKVNNAASKQARLNTNTLIDLAQAKEKPLSGEQMVDAFDIFYARARFLETHALYGAKNEPPSPQVIWLNTKSEAAISDLTLLIAQNRPAAWVPHITSLDPKRGREQLTVPLALSQFLVLDGAFPTTFTGEQISSVIAQLLVFGPANSIIVVIDRHDLHDRLLPRVAMQVHYVNLVEELTCNEKITGEK